MSRHLPLPRSLRGRLALGALGITAVWVLVLTAAFHLVLEHRLDAQADDLLRTRADAVAALVTVDADGRVALRKPAANYPIDRGVWVYAGSTAIVRPAAEPSLQRSADALAGAGGGFRSPSDDLRLYALPIVVGGARVATVVAALDLDAYATVADDALAGSVALAIVFLALAYGTTWVVVGRALSPMEQMARQAAEWSAHDLEHRFGRAPRPTELDRLARILDELLARQSAVVRSDQRLTAELSHELRTPVAVLSAELELLRGRPRTPAELEAGHAAIAAAAGRMNAVLETLLAEARGRAGTVPGRAVVAEVLAAVARQMPGRLVRVDPAPDPASTAGVDPALLERILAPLVENAVRHAVSEVRLTAEATADGVRVLVRDDGPGVDPAMADRVFDPGFSDRPGGAGLGLPLARRLARGAGGDVTVEPGDGFRVDLPAG